MAEYEALQDRFARERPHPSEAEFTAFFPHGWRLSTVENATDIDEEALFARMASSSWAPKQDDAGYPEMVAELRRLFQEYSQNGRLRMIYETRIYHGRLD
jgi:hypothetical protein